MEPQLSINIRKDTNMKDTKQIIDDCGIADTRAGSFLALIVSRKFTPFHADGAIVETMGEIIGALYRRIETLENGPYEAEEGADVCSVCDTVFAPKTLLAINEAEFELICPECMLARIKKLEEENASFIKDLKLQSERLAELETWNEENQGI